MAQRRKTQTPTPADPAAALAAEMARPVTFFDVLEIGDNEARWERLVRLCESASRANNPAEFPPTDKRSAVVARFYTALSPELQKQYRTLESWDSASMNIYADAGFRLGLAMGRNR